MPGGHFSAEKEWGQEFVGDTRAARLQLPTETVQFGVSDSGIPLNAAHEGRQAWVKEDAA